MDELNREYNPIDEYATITDDTTQQAVSESDNTPDTEDVKKDDVFEAFDKAQSEQGAPVPPAPSTVEHSTPVPPSQPIPPQYTRPVPPYMPTNKAQPCLLYTSPSPRD